MTRDEHEEVRVELAAMLAAWRNSSKANTPAMIRRIEIVQRAYDVWVKELLPT